MFFETLRRHFFFLRSNKGYSLIELMVTIGIIAVFIGAGTINIRRLTQRQEVEGEAREIETAIRDAQKRSSAQVKRMGGTAICDSVVGEVLAGYSIRLGTLGMNNRQYRIFARCLTPASNEFDVVKTLKPTVYMDSGIQIHFDNLGRANNDYTLCLTNIQGTYFFQININAGGAIFTERVNSC